MSELTLIHNVQIHAPEPLGPGWVALAASQIVAVGAGEPEISGLPVMRRDGGGRRLLPGFVDNHVHVAGGGGSAGFGSRSRPLRPIDFVGGSTTSVIGMLGFDSTTRGIRGLLADLKALRSAGLGAYALVGSTRRHPVPTLTGSIADDIVFVEEVIGAGEISLSELGYEFDSFGSGSQYVATVASETILAGRLAQTGGYVCLQVPPHAGANMTALFELVERTGIPRRHLLPSHVNQSPDYLDNAKAWGLAGGWVDVGTGYRPDRGFVRAVDPCDAVEQLLAAGVPDERILLSSDGNGVVPDPTGRPVYMELSTLHEVWQRLVLERRLPLEVALRMVSTNVATYARLPRKGRVAPGFDADLVLVDDALEVVETFVAGRPLTSAVRSPAD